MRAARLLSAYRCSGRQGLIPPNRSERRQSWRRVQKAKTERGEDGKRGQPKTCKPVYGPKFRGGISRRLESMSATARLLVAQFILNAESANLNQRLFSRRPDAQRFNPNISCDLMGLRDTQQFPGKRFMEMDAERI